MDAKVVGETILFLVGLPMFAFQTTEMLQALIEFISQYPYNR